LRNNDLAIHRLEGGAERRTLGSGAELREALADLIKVQLTVGADVDALLEKIATMPPI
jgi:hypothetical protein